MSKLTIRNDQLADEPIGVRELAHDTTRILRDLETNEQLVMVTKHGRIIALLVPMTVSTMAQDWLDRHPSYSAAMRSGSPEGNSPGDSTADVESGPDRDVVEVGIKEFSQATSEYVRKAEEGDWVFLRRRNRIIALLMSFSLSDVVRWKLDNDPNFKIAPNARPTAAAGNVDVEQDSESEAQDERSSTYVP